MKKLLLSMITIAALLLTACSKSLKVESVKQLTVEYGDKLDNSKLYDASKSEKDIKVAEVKGFDSMKVGNEKVKITFTDKDGKSKTEKEIMIEIKDTKAPVIVLDKDEVSIEQGNNIDLTKNIKSIKDPVDGDIKYSKSKVDKDGYYIDKGKLDKGKPGTYEIKVIAIDKNGNKAEKSFKVKVTKKEEKKETAKQPAEQQTTGGQKPSATKPSGNSSTGQTPSRPQNNSGGNQVTQPAKPQRPSCTIPSNQYGNSGKMFKTQAEADAYGDLMESSHMDSINGYTVLEMADTCDNSVGWTVDFDYAK